MRNLDEVFEILTKYKLRLNTVKCSFEIIYGKFQGHLVTRWEFEANLEQIISIKDLESPRIVKEV